MAERVLSPATYLIVLGILVVLTVLTVGASFIELPGVVHIVVGLTIAVAKALLVALFFMHVLFSPRVTWIVILVTTFWLVGVLFMLTFSDYATRGLIPFLYGH